MNAVAAFLDPLHERLVADVTSWTERELRHRRESADDAAARHEAREVLARIGAAGWLDVLATQDLRGLCVIRETVAAASPLADAVVAIQALGATPLVLAGSGAQRARWLPEIVNGHAMAAFAMSEPEAGSDAAALQTTARRDGDGWVISGAKHLISNAGLADIHLVFAKTSPDKGSRGISLFLVPSGAPGLEFAGPQVLSAAHPLGRLRLHECRVESSAVVGEVDGGFKVGMMTLDRLRATVGAAACGMAARALSEAVSHARSRRQFGQPLSAMALVREKIGRMATDLDAARLLVYRAAWEHSRGAPRISVAAAMAKSFATEAAQTIVDEAVQICGGPGVVMGHPVERLYRAVRALRIYEGATDIQRLIVADGLLKEADQSGRGR